MYATPPRSRRVPRAPGFLALITLSIGLAACDDDDDDVDPPPAPVSTTVVSAETVDRHAVYPGRLRGAREVEVRARVEGVLEERTHVEGAAVEAGDTLFRIDRRPFEIALLRAEAEVANARAAIDEAQREWRRIQGLYERDATSTRERDRARSALDLAEAQLAMAEAGRDDARLQLSYTEVEAPLEGVTGLERVPEGSLLEPGTLLTTITERDPMHLRFSLPEADALARQVRTAEDDRGARASAELVLADGNIYEYTGEIDFTDARVDPATGTITARAVFPNPDDALRSGQFRRVRVLIEELEDVFVVPERAVAEARDGPHVYVVEDGKAVSRAVALGPVVDGRQVLHDGLADGDEVIVDGLAGLGDGDEVSVRDNGNDEGGA